jgi:hypothetical protein
MSVQVCKVLITLHYNLFMRNKYNSRESYCSVQVFLMLFDVVS